MEDSWTQQLIGRAVESVRRRDDGSCVITLAGGYRVQIDCLWRLLEAGKLALTSGDDGQLFGRSEPLLAVSELAVKLIGHVLDTIQIAQGTVDLTLHFRGHVLQVVSDSTGYEAWQVEGPAGTVAVGQGGGNVAVLG